MAMNVDPRRYEGKPLLRLLEAYVLHSVGALSEEQAHALEAMTPKLQQLYGVEGRWDEIIAGVMDLPQSLPGEIRQTWEKNKRIGAQAGEELTPEDFAIMFVDANFQSS